MKKTTKNAPAKKPEKIKQIEREPIMLTIEKLHIAPWNPRGEITEESVADLIPTIKSKGLIQRIAVVWDWASDGDKYEYEFAYCSKCCHMEHAGWNTHEEAKREIIDFCQEYKYCPNCGAHMIDGRYEESKRKRTSTKKGGV